MQTQRLLRVSEVAERLAHREGTIRAWLSEGRLPRVRVGPRSIRIPSEAVEKLIREIGLEEQDGSPGLILS
jgi:excisionase family DNA binding protein